MCPWNLSAASPTVDSTSSQPNLFFPFEFSAESPIIEESSQITDHGGVIQFLLRTEYCVNSYQVSRLRASSSHLPVACLAST